MAAPGAGEVEVRTLHSAVSRGTESLVFRGQVPGQRIRAHARTVSGRRVSRAGQVRLRQRRHRRARARQAARAGPSSACIPIRPATSCRPLPCIRCPTACRRRARCSPPTWRRRSTRSGTRRRGSATASRGRRRGRRLLVAGSPARIPGCEVELVDIDPRARRGRAAGRRLRAADAARGRGRPRPARQRPARRAWARRSGWPRFEATRRRAELVRAARGAAAARRGLPCAAADARSLQVGHVAAGAARALEPRRRLALALSLLARSGARRADHRQRAFDALPRCWRAWPPAPRTRCATRIDYA